MDIHRCRSCGYRARSALRVQSYRVSPAETAGRNGGDAVNAGTMTRDEAGDAWQMWADQGGPAGEDYMRGYITSGAEPWW
jgi:hypothetical protein